MLENTQNNNFDFLCFQPSTTGFSHLHMSLDPPKGNVPPWFFDSTELETPKPPQRGERITPRNGGLMAGLMKAHWFFLKADY